MDIRDDLYEAVSNWGLLKTLPIAAADELIIKGLLHDDEEVRDEAASALALGKLGAARHLPIIHDCMTREKDEHVLMMLMRAVVNLNSPTSYHTVTALVTERLYADDRYEPCELLTLALVYLRNSYDSSDTFVFLEKILLDQSAYPWFQAKAVETLDAATAPANAATNELLCQLVRLYAGDVVRSGVADHAVRAIGHRKYATAIPMLLECLNRMCDEQRSRTRIYLSLRALLKAFQELRPLFSAEQNRELQQALGVVGSWVVDPTVVRSIHRLSSPQA